MSAQQSIPDMAADVVARLKEVGEQIENLRSYDSDKHPSWTAYRLLVEEAYGVAHQGLRQAWCLLDRIGHLVAETEKKIGHKG